MPAKGWDLSTRERVAQDSCATEERVNYCIDERSSLSACVDSGEIYGGYSARPSRLAPVLIVSVHFRSFWRKGFSVGSGAAGVDPQVFGGHDGS